MKLVVNRKTVLSWFVDSVYLIVLGLLVYAGATLVSKRWDPEPLFTFNQLTGLVILIFALTVFMRQWRISRIATKSKDSKVKFGFSEGMEK